MLLSTIVFAACSKSSNPVEGLLPAFEPPPAPTTKEQAVPDNMPEIPNDAVYLGTQALVIGQSETLLVETNSKYGIYDFEFVAQEEMGLFFDQLFTAHQGGCSNPVAEFEWVNINEGGDVLVTTEVGVFSYFKAFPGERYILRAHVKEFSECDSANLGIKVVQQN